MYHLTAVSASQVQNETTLQVIKFLEYLGLYLPTYEY